MLSRAIEAEGIATVSLSLVREHTAKLKAPRALFVPFPFGMSLGRPHQDAEQQAVLDMAFEMLSVPQGPVLIDFPDVVGAVPGSPVQASQVPPSANESLPDLATEVTAMRRYWEQRVDTAGRTAVGLTRVPVPRFRGIVRFLEAFLADERVDSDDRPQDISRVDFVRCCSDDLKALYYEARGVMKPGESARDTAHWLWGETQLGAFLRRLQAHMNASADPYTKATAYGIAR